METVNLSPREIVSELDRYIIGQNDAKRAVAIALRNRWRRQQLPEGIREDRTTGETKGFIFSVDGEPAGYIQSWLPVQYESERWAKNLTPDTPGIDIFVGPAEMTGKGVASRAIRAFVPQLFAGTAPRVIIDPDAGNIRALRAYAKAGFTPYGEWNDSSGRTILMELTRTEFERTR